MDTLLFRVVAMGGIIPQFFLETVKRVVTQADRVLWLLFGVPGQAGAGQGWAHRSGGEHGMARMRVHGHVPW